MATIELRMGGTLTAGAGAPPPAGGKGRVISGYAALFNVETTIGGLFREVIEPGAFGKALQRSDIRLLLNHHEDKILGRVKAGTLAVVENARGLWYRGELPDAATGRDVLEAIRRGDISQSSFAFIVAPGGDRWDYTGVKAGRLPLRVIHQVAELFDVAPVVYPATEATTVGLLG